MAWRAVTYIVLGLALLGAGALFWIQNSLRMMDLSLDLYFLAFKLQNPAPIPALLLVTFIVVLVIGIVLTLLMRRSPSVDSGRVGSSASGGDLWT